MTTPLLASPSRCAAVPPAPGRGCAAVLCFALLTAVPALAQVETFVNKRGSSVGPATKVVPTNCVQGPDGSLTCDTKIENPPGDTIAEPQFSPFKN